MHGHCVLGAKLKRLRVKAGLTQEQLAQLVDCSDRLIRRAEGCFPVRYSTLEKIAVALSDFGQKVVPSDLIASHLAIAKRLWASYQSHGRSLPDFFPHFSEDIHWIVSGPTSTIPFAGNWKGLDQVRFCLTRFYESIERQHLSACRPLFLESDGHVTIKYTEQWQRVSKRQTSEQMWVHFHLSFHDGMIRRVEHQFDTLAAYRLFADHH